MGEEKLRKAQPEAASVPTLSQVLETVKEHEESNSPASDYARFAKVELEKRYALIMAWEENEKAKVENMIHKKLAAVDSWETRKRSNIEMKIKKYEEQVERQKVEYAEIMKNKMAEIHLAAEEKKATIQAEQSEDCLKLEETAAKFRSVGHVPGKCLGCCGS